jgi:hypothetical protein
VTATLIADPRPRTRRRSDTEYRLAHDVDVWVATASADGAPYLVPLSFDWDGDSLILATPADSPTGRNLADTGAVRLALGSTRDVTMIDGDADVPRTLPTAYRWYRVTPRRIQAWREVDELPERELMRDGRWSTPSQ